MIRYSEQWTVKVGQRATAKRVFSQTDFDRFARLSGDDNPIHVDATFAAKTRFKRPVCHGMLLYSTLCQLLGAELPGPGTVQLEQSLMFPTPTFIGEEMTVDLEVVDMGLNEGTAVLETTITHQDGRVACQGQTTVALDPSHFREKTVSGSALEAPAVEAFKGLQLGQQATTIRVFTRDDLAEFADLTGDSNPLFTDTDYAQKVGLQDTMIPGGLIGGLFSYLLGTELPGRGTNWLKQHLIFHTPAYPGDEIVATVQVNRLRPDKELVNLNTRCVKSSGELVCSGEALVLVKDLEEEVKM